MKYKLQHPFSATFAKKIFLLQHKYKIIFTTILIVWLAYSYFAPPERMFLTSKDGTIRIEVPYEIVEAQDCSKYQDWFHEHFTPMLMTSDRCPWRKPPKGPIGEFEMNGVKLHVPREYLLFDKSKQDGREDSILNLLMQYPDMGPVLNDEKNDGSHVQVSIYSSKWIKEKEDCAEIDIEERWCHNPSLFEYAGKNGFNSRQYQKLPYVIEKIQEIPELNLTQYKLNLYYNTFIRGDVLNPTYWIKCEGQFPCCETFINYDDKLYFSVFFRQEALFKYQDEIVQKVIKKITQFKTASMEVQP